MSAQANTNIMSGRVKAALPLITFRLEEISRLFSHAPALPVFQAIE
ncbi:hypothetical protein LT85_0667 [Collimonas arenae]|uniref:Uncharacterized protein n=1 Tax=Collimonas arenae TaxID=279058 RepID=A0A0A1FAG3_9BURK|nr:hypothetical protein LT85_0667 [Collimonas arenae]